MGIPIGAGHRSPVPTVGWIEQQQSHRAHIVGVELDEDSIRLQQLRPAIQLIVVLLGHEHAGLPSEVWSCLDQVVEIPMVGVGRSLNVAVAGSLVLYKLAGLA